jgi:predicted transcriptional regulator
MKTILMLSIRESHAQNILAGRKKVELRRVRSKLEKGDVVLIYAPRPVMALVGGFVVKEVIVAQPGQLWRQVGSVSGLTKHQFTHYYSGASVAFGICIDTPWRLDKPVSFAVLRRCWSRFTPPQCFRYLGAKEMRMAKSFNINLISGESFNGRKSTFPLFEQHPRPRLKVRSCDPTLHFEEMP